MVVARGLGHAARFSTLHTYAKANVHHKGEGSAASEPPAAPHPGHVTASSVRSVSPAGWPVIGRNAIFFLKLESRFCAIEAFNHSPGVRSLANGRLSEIASDRGAAPAATVFITHAPATQTAFA